jgi:hypothetical protein
MLSFLYGLLVIFGRMGCYNVALDILNVYLLLRVLLAFK